MLALILLLAYWQISGYKYVYGENKKEVDFSLLLPCLLLFYFAAMRAVTVGADTKQYRIVFQLCAEERWSNLITSQARQLWFRLDAMEIGYKYYNKLLSYLWENPQMITIANSFFIIAPLYRLIYKYSPDRWLSVFLFFTFGFYQTSLNLTPSAIASLIALNGLEYIEERKPIRYILCVLAASVFHYSAFLFLPMYFLSYFKLTAKRFWMALGGMFGGIIAAFSALLTILWQIVPVRYQGYLQAKILPEQLFVYVVQLLLVVYCIWRSGGQEGFWRKNQLYLNYFLVESAAYFCTLFSSGFSRAAFLFSPLLAVTIPNLMEREEEEILQKEQYQHPLILRISKSAIPIVLYGVAIYLVRISVNNIGTTMPYVFYWMEGF